MAEPFPEVELDPKIQAMIDAGNAARASGQVNPAVIRDETDDSKSYATAGTVTNPTEGVLATMVSSVETPDEEVTELIPKGPRKLSENARGVVKLAHDDAARNRRSGQSTTQH